MCSVLLRPPVSMNLASIMSDIFMATVNVVYREKQSKINISHCNVQYKMMQQGFVYGNAVVNYLYYVDCVYIQKYSTSVNDSKTVLSSSQLLTPYLIEFDNGFSK